MIYSENGFWIEQLDDQYIIGLSTKGQDDLGLISFVEFSHDEYLTVDNPFLSVEAAKAVTDLMVPLAGKVVCWHEEAEDNPDLLNDLDRNHNWIVKLTEVKKSHYNNLLDK